MGLRNTMNTILKTSNLNKVYKLGGLVNRVQINALDDVNLTIESDKPVIISVVGESGSGKTTLLQETAGRIGDKVNMKILVGDLETERDADRQGRVLADRALDGDLELLAGDGLGQPLAVAQRPRARELAVDELGEGVDLLAVHEDVDLDHVPQAVVEELVVERPVALGDGFEPVVKVVDHLSQGDFEYHFQAFVGQVLIVLVDAPSIHAKLHNCSHIPVRHNDGRLAQWRR